MNKESLWRTLFLILLTVNITGLAISYNNYSSAFRPIHISLQEDFDSALQNASTDAYPIGGYQTLSEQITRLKTLKPPLWKISKHEEYVTLVSELSRMGSQIHRYDMGLSTDSLRLSYGHYSGMKPADIEQRVQIMAKRQQKQEEQRQQAIPKYKIKLERLRELGKALS